MENYKHKTYISLMGDRAMFFSGGVFKAVLSHGEGHVSLLHLQSRGERCTHQGFAFGAGGFVMPENLKSSTYTYTIQNET